MPKINRVRIVNFSYNNNNRHILDECFDFFGGENALLSLVNGGGKSVLVQAVLQPILPKVSMLGRRFGDFFAQKKTPSYIMTEWKLDDEAGYLLTGIAVTSRTVHSANEEEESTDIRYFTFTSFYEKGNEFDIRNIPVTEQIENRVRIASYHEFKKLLEREAGRHNHDINVYDSEREEQIQYEAKLSSCGISREEWRELILSINEAEHGVSEVFSECKTSRKVMEQWIIKYIEKVLNKSSSGTSDHKKLETMVGQVAQALVDNENHIREYRAIQSFSQELKAMSGEAGEVLARLDREDGLKKDIGSGYQFLKQEEERLGQELGSLANRQRELAGELEGIDLEEKSRNIYQYTAEVQALEGKLTELTEAIVKLEALHKEKNYRLNIYRAAERYEKISLKNKEIAELQQRLDNASKDQESLLNSLNQIKYSLKTAYDRSIKDISSDMGEGEIKRSECLTKAQQAASQYKNCQSEADRITHEKGGVDREIANFEKEEHGTLKDLGIQLFRNPLLKELDGQEVQKVKIVFAERLQEVETQLEQNRSEDENLKAALETASIKKDELAAQASKLKVAKSQAESRIGSYQDEERKILEAMRRLDIDESYLFDPVYRIKASREYLHAWENKAYDLKMEISEVEKQLHDVESGVSYLPSGLIKRFKENSLEYFTGETYLREREEEEKKRLLDRNPLLPYSLIVTEKELIRMKEIISEMDLSQVIPVIKHNSRDLSIGLGYENIQLITSPKNMALNKDDLNLFITGLKHKSEGLSADLQNAAEVIERVGHDCRTIVDFTWTQLEVTELGNELKRIETEILENEESIRVSRRRIEEMSGQRDLLVKQREDLSALLSECQRKIKGFEDYLNSNEKYMENVRHNVVLQSRLNSLNAEKKRFDEEKTQLEDKANELRIFLEEQNRSKKALEEKQLEVHDAAACEPAEGAIPELEGRLKAYKGQQNTEVADLREQIRRTQRDIQDYEKEIRKLKLESDEYREVKYSEREEAELEEQIDRLQRKLDGERKEEGQQRSQKAVLDDRIKAARDALGSRTIVLMEDIKGNFVHRREEIHRERHDNEGRSNQLHNEQIALAKLINTIEVEIKDIQYIGGKPLRGLVNDVKASIHSMLKDYNDSKRSTDKAVQEFQKRCYQFSDSYKNSEEGTVKEAVKGLKSQIDLLERSFDKYYYLTERIEYYLLQLSQILKIMESKMLQLEHSQKDLAQHAFMEAIRVYHEIPKISENSTVEIDGERKKVLQIDFDEMGDELQAREKMASYVQECLQSLTKLIKSNEEDNKLRREIEKCMSTRELLNIISSLENCKIKAYKVDLNEKNRRMMPWEDIIVKNSGGEKFVAYFSLLVALISYSRKQTKGYEMFKHKEESKVLIMDNPFGPITSGHLLKPMFDIAKKYNTQLICLSDIKQGSVVSSFDLIYMIRIRQNMMQEDYIELEPIMLKELKQDEKLENAYLYGRVEQMSLFE